MSEQHDAEASAEAKENPTEGQDTNEQSEGIEIPQAPDDHQPKEGEVHCIFFEDGTAIRLKRLPRKSMDEVFKHVQANNTLKAGNMILRLCCINEDAERKQILNRLDNDDGFFLGAALEALKVVEYTSATLKKSSKSIPS